MPEVKILENITINEPVADLTALNAIPTASLEEGLVCMVNSVKSFYRWNGAIWEIYATSGPVDSVQLATGNPNPTHSEGLLFYDDTEKAASYYNDNSDVTVNIGQESLIRVYNNSGVQINNGSVVYISGAEGTEGRATIELAIATSSATSQVLGVVTHDIANSSFGYVTQFGNVNDFDTSSFSAGDTVFLSDSVAGELQATSPISPNFSVFIGYVLVSDAVNGRIFVTALGNTGGTAAGDSTEVTKIARKGSPGTINPGEVVYVSGYNVGQAVVEVELANSSSSTSMPSIGIANSSISNSVNGSVTISGQITGIDTSLFTAGDEIYVDTIDGQLTNTKPVGNNFIQKVGIVLRSHASSGVILVIGAGRANDIPNFTNADKFWYGGTGGVATEGDITAAGRALLDDIDAGSQRITLNVNPISSIVNITTIDSPYAGDVDRTIAAAATTGNIVVNLPACSSANAGKDIAIICTDTATATYKVTADADGTDLINGAGTQDLTADYDGFVLRSDGISNWYIVG